MLGRPQFKDIYTIDSQYPQRIMTHIEPVEVTPVLVHTLDCATNSDNEECDCGVVDAYYDSLLHGAPFRSDRLPNKQCRLPKQQKG